MSVSPVDVFDSKVIELLQTTRFPGDEFSGSRHRASEDYWEKCWRRATAYAQCCRVSTGRRCVNCKFEAFRYSVKCHLRGCSRCGPSVRLLLSNRYLRRLRSFDNSLLWFVTFTYPHVEVGSKEGFMLDCVRKVSKRFRWIGMLASLELVEKRGVVVYEHIHALVVAKFMHKTAVKDEWTRLTQADRVDIERVRNRNRVVGYITEKGVAGGYGVKGAVKAITPEGLVQVMSRLFKKKLVRAYGALARRASNELVRVASSLSDSLTKGRLRELEYVCQRCGKDEWEFFTEGVISNSVVEGNLPSG